MTMLRKSGKAASTVPQIPRPHSGQTLGVVAPGSPISKDLLEAGCARLQRLGYKTFYFDSILESDLYFAGAATRRARELEEMFKREEIAGIICARGGYGSNYLLPELNMDVIRAHPKMFMGYSDITTLLTYFCDHADMVTFHGPMVTADFAIDSSTVTAGVSLKFQYQTLSGETGSGEQPVTGEASGILYGGCLSMLAASLGTAYEIQTQGTILFIEDIATKPFQIDRMLMQLKLAGKFTEVRGICFGEMVDCVQPKGQDYTLVEVIRRVLGDLDIPVGYGLRSGHVSAGGPNYCLPIGLPVNLTVADDRATISSL